MRTRCFLVLLGLLVASAGLALDARAGIVPPDGTYAGRTYNDWQVLWWQQMLATPVTGGGEHPLINGGPFGGADNVLFLAAIGGGATFDLTISANTALFLPVVNVECSELEPDPFHGDDEAERRACAAGHVDTATGLIATFDGSDAVTDLADFRFSSPEFTVGPLPADNIFAFFGIPAPEGTTTPAVDDGYYLLFEPLTRGRHEIRVAGTIESLGATIDSTFRLNVVPEPSGLATAGMGLVAALAGSRRRRWRMGRDRPAI